MPVATNQKTIEASDETKQFQKAPAATNPNGAASLDITDDNVTNARHTTVSPRRLSVPDTNVENLLRFRQISGVLMVFWGIADVASDVSILILWLINGDYSWAILLFIAIMITNTWSAYHFHSLVDPSWLTILCSIFGLGSLRILKRFWNDLDQDFHYRTLIDSRFVETMTESIPSAILQSYVIILSEEYDTLLIISNVISVLSLAFTLDKWYTFSYNSEGNIQNEIEFHLWQVVCQIYICSDFIVRAIGLAFFLVLVDLRPYSLIFTPLS